MKQRNVTEFIRVDKTNNYTVIHNQFLRRKDLSWKAKGILAYILSLPDDWNINLKEVMTHATDGEASFRSGWKELSDKGYVKRRPVRDGQRIKHWETIVYENVDTERSSLLGGFQDVDNLDVDNLDVDNRNLLSTKDTKYLKELSTDNTKDIVEQSSQSDKSDDVPYKEIINHLNERADRQFRHTTNKTKRLIKARANEGFDLDDFKQVIDTKAVEWKEDSEMSKYLRPETLFGTKFESYLNQPVRNVGKERDWDKWEFM